MRAVTGIALAAFLFVGSVASVGAQEDQPIPQPVLEPLRALVISELADPAATIGAMQTRSWDVSTSNIFGAFDDDLLAEVDVVWIPTGHHYFAALRLSEAGTPLDEFTKAGGMVVVADIASTEPYLLNIAPGGGSVELTTDTQAMTVLIGDDMHPIVTGDWINGTPITELDLDSIGAGVDLSTFGLGEDSPPIIIGTNELGPVFVEYPYEFGRVFICTLSSPDAACVDNLLAYLELIDI